jgi:hypothetical protein
MNNLGHVAGWSQYFGQGEPSLRGWVWTPQDGFTVLASPPDMFMGRFRAMDISDTGIVDGDDVVGILDFLALLEAWGPYPDPPEPCLADFDGDRVVSITDFLILLGNWG